MGTVTLRVDPRDILQADGDIIRLGRRGKKRTEADIIGAFRRGRPRPGRRLWVDLPTRAAGPAVAGPRRRKGHPGRHGPRRRPSGTSPENH